MLLHTTFVSLWDGGWGVQAPASQTDYRLWLALSGGSERSLAKHLMSTTHLNFSCNRKAGD